MKKTNILKFHKLVLFVILLSFAILMSFNLVHANSAKLEEDTTTSSQVDIDALFAKEVQTWIDGYNRRN